MAKGGWVTAQIEEQELTYTYEAHKPVTSKAFPWLRCQHCGLLFLKNTATKKAIKAGCNYALKRG